MANRKIYVDLAFGADISQAKTQMQELQRLLSNLNSGKTIGNLPLTNELIQAKKAAAELQYSLQKATNVDTGRLNLASFNQQLINSGKTMNDYKSALMSLGPNGQKAFMTLNRSIIDAEVPLKRTSGLLKTFGESLKRAAGWQISSTILHGFMSAISTAVKYSEDLNESLNKIRIVSEQNAASMEKFAQKANEAARALSATTLDYTNAALIYYQQGLGEEEIEKRTEVTLKMANVTGQTAKVVSDQLTAIWNNFDDGSKSLEYYADAITALGAATASSTDEIAQGLEKFAAVSETVGLSYEYATAALATVTAETRQSADVVGTAFKTIFARIQGLKLGETLDDGTTLNQYSEALYAVGINIKDANGELKDMDSILNEMGEVWDTLNRDEQVALAQKVAGIRQYSQLMALMENWDTVQQNITLAKDSSGTLEKQQDIYAESWDAASDRVRASLESIFENLIDDDFMIDMLNGFEKILNVVNHLVEAMGGFKGILAGVSVLMLKSFGKNIATSINSSLANSYALSEQGKQDVIKDKTQGFNNIIAANQNKTTMESQANVQVAEREKQLYTDLYKVADQLTEEELQRKQVLLDQERLLGEQYIAAANRADTAKTRAEGSAMDMRDLMGVGMAAEEAEKATASFDKVHASITKMANQAARGNKYIDELIAIDDIQDAEEYEKALDSLVRKFEKLAKEAGKVGNAQSQGTFSKLAEAAWQAKTNPAKKGEAVSQAKRYKANETLDSQYMTASKKQFDGISKSAEVTSDNIKEYTKKQLSGAKATQEAYTANKNYHKTSEDMKTDILATTKAIPKFGDSIVGVAQGVTSLSFAITSLSSIKDVLTNEDLTPFQKMGKIITSLGMAIPMLITGMKALKTSVVDMGMSIMGSGLTAMVMQNTEMTKANATIASQILLNKKLTAEEKIAALQKKLNLDIKQATLLVENAENMTMGQALKLKMGEIIKNKAAAATKFAESGSRMGNVAAMIAETLAAWGLNAAMAPLVAVILLLVVAIGAVVAIAFVLVSVFNAIKNSTPEAKLAAAKDEAKALGEQLEKAKEASEALKSSIESYETAVDKMKSLTKGTEEYKQAVQEANDAARKLIDEYEELKGQYKFNAETGLIEFNKDALDNLYEITENQVKNLTNSKLNADNAVLVAQNTYDANEQVKGLGLSKYSNDNDTVEQLLEGMETRLRVSAGIMTLGYSELALGVWDSIETSVLESLGRAMYESNGNFTEAMNSLTLEQQALINSLGMTDVELQNLAQELANNTAAIIENNKEIIENSFQNNSAYQTSANKDFLNSIMSRELQKEQKRLYETVYKDKIGGKQDSTIQEEYAKAMGWDPKLVENEGGNTAIYYDKDNNEIKLSDETARQYLAQQAALNSLNETIDENAKKVEKLRIYETQLSSTYSEQAEINGHNIQSFKEYKDKVMQYGKALGLSQKNLEDYIANFGNLTNASKVASMAENLIGLGYKEENINRYIESLTKNLNDEQIELVLQASVDAMSIDDFQRKVDAAITEGFIRSIQGSSKNIEDIMTKAVENNKFDASDFLSLKQDDNFVQYLEETDQTITDIMAKGYAERTIIMADFYRDLKEAEKQALEDSKKNYQIDLAEYQAIINYKRALSDGNTDIANELAAQFQNVDFSMYADMDISEIQTKFDEIQARIDEIDNQTIKLDLEWETTEMIEKSISKFAEFASFIDKDTKTINGKIQMTAAEFKKWGQIYPEIGKKAEVLNNGLVQFDKEYLTSFTNTQEEATNVVIDENIKQLQSHLSQLDAEEEILKADLELAEAKATGKDELEQASADYLTELRKNLTDYYIKEGLSEVDANAEALTTMGLNEKTYNDLVTKGAIRTAQNQEKLTNATVQGQANALSWLYERFKTFFSSILEAGKKLFEGDFTGAWDAIKGEAGGIVGTLLGSTLGPAGAIIGSTVGNILSSIDSEQPEETGFLSSSSVDSVKRAEGLKEATKDTKDTIYAKLQDIADRRQSIENEILYQQALKEQGIKKYNETDEDSEEGDKSEAENIEIPEEVVERYKELNDALEEAEHQTEKLGRTMDKAYGAEKIKKINEVNKSLAEEVGLLQARLKEEEGYLLRDSAAVLSQSVKLGDETYSMGFEVEDDKVTNYNAVMGFWNDKLAEAITHYNSLTSKEEQEAYEKTVIEPLEKALENGEKVVSQLDETRKQKQETETEIEEKLDEIKEGKIEGINYKVELRMELSEEDREQIEKQIEALGEKIYTSEERVIKLMEKLPSLDADLKAIQEADQKLEEMYEGKEKDTAYYEVKKELRDRAKEVVEATEEMSEAIREAWLNAFESAAEEIEKITNKWESLNGQLEHYQNILGLIGRENDFEAQNILLDGQMTLAEDQLETSKATLDMYKAQRKEKQQELDDYKKGVAEGTREQDQLWEDSLTANIEAIDEAINETQSKIYESTEAYFEYAKSKWENLGKIASKELSDALAGKNYSSLETLETAFDYIEKANDGILTRTNQLYETNKLINQAQLKIDKTNSATSKRKYNDYIKYINQLKNAKEISEFDLKVAQQKFELLQAQIALEDSRNAKSTVKLSRDAEGNWGYVYTADQNTISEAEQKVADEENKLYNLGLEESQKANSKQFQILKEYYDSATDLGNKFRSGEIVSKQEYDAQMAALEENTKIRLLNANNTYFSARDLLNETSSNNLENNLFIDLINIKKFDEIVKDYRDNDQKSWEEWGKSVKDISEQAGLDFISFGNMVGDKVGEINLNLQDMTTKTNNVKDSSNELKIALIGEDGESGLVKALADELTAVSNVVDKNGEHATKLGEVKSAAKDFVKYSTETLRPELDLLNKTDVDITITTNSDVADKVQEAKEKLAEIPQTVTTYIQTIRLSEGEAPPGNTGDYTTGSKKSVDKNELEYLDSGYFKLKGSTELYHYSDIDSLKDYSYDKIHSSNIDLIKDSSITLDTTKAKVYSNTDNTSATPDGMRYSAVAYTDGSGGYFYVGDPETKGTVKNPEARSKIEKVETTSSGTKFYLIDDKYYLEKDLTPIGSQTLGAGAIVKTPSVFKAVQYDEVDIPDNLKAKGSIPGANSITVLNENKTAFGTGTLAGKNSNGEYDYLPELKNRKIVGYALSKKEGHLYRLDDYIKVWMGDYSTQTRWIKGSDLAELGMTGWPYQNYNLQKFDTGGYTGQWGPEGKLAVLHEKEIILNKNDTQNFLQAIGFIRPIAGVIDSLAKTMSLGKLGFGQVNLKTTEEQPLQQEIHISAEFPNVQDHNEIEMALNQMIEQSSQYAYRTTI